MNPKDRLIIALDLDTEEKVVRAVDTLKGEVRFFKVGLELFSSCGPGIIKIIKEKDCDIFLDLKFHDIPNTVARAAAVVTRLGVYMFNVHAMGGCDMMKEAAASSGSEAARLGIDRPKILGVTVLTSMDVNSLKKAGITGDVQSQVLKLAEMAKKAGLDGVVASPAEVKAIRRAIGEDFLIVTPGVRPSRAAANDQKRIATPKEAIKAGADFIVVGRPVMEARNPVEAAGNILKEIE